MSPFYKRSGRSDRSGSHLPVPAVSTTSASTTRTTPTLGQSQPVTTSFLLGNLHCPTCVTAIKDALNNSSRQHIHWVSPNIVTSVVTVEHAPAASISSMASELKQAGFEICGVTTTSASEVDVANELDAAATVSANEAHGGGIKETQPAHLQNCRECQIKAESGAAAGTTTSPSTSPTCCSSSPPVSDGTAVNKSSLAATFPAVEAGPSSALPSSSRQPLTQQTNSEPGTTTTATTTTSGSSGKQNGSPPPPPPPPPAPSTSAPIMSAKSFVTVETEERKLWRATLAVGGMTCSACTNAITDELNKQDWIANTTVSLLTNSATVDFFDAEANADKVAEAIEDIGFEATVDSVLPLHRENDNKEQDDEKDKPKAKNSNTSSGSLQQHQGPVERTVEIAIDGMHCDACPRHVVQAVEGFSSSYAIRVTRAPTRNKPRVEIAYTPQAPVFNIRRIIAAIEAADPHLKASVFHPPTLEERSKQIQRKHQRSILLRVFFSTLISIPTFILGVVYMSLIPPSNPDKHDLMMPWVSGISRLQFALFILATPVYFFAADVFHRRAIKEIWTLWRPGSRTPFLQRFYRFGSMNTLMSLGTTIAYVSSMSQMVAAAVRQPKAVNDSNFFFDTVVFLTVFLLAGRAIESYSKSKTGEAVGALARLTPPTATLVVQVGGGSQENSNKGDGRLQPQSHIEDIKTAVTEDQEIKTDLLDYGDVVRVPHGASPPADGIVVSSSSSGSSTTMTTFDESSLTGESRPVKKHAGSPVYAGTVNSGSSAVLIRITGTAGSTMLDNIVRVVREGQAKRAPVERIADRITSYFVPSITLVAVATFVVWVSLGYGGLIGNHFLDVTSGGWFAFSLQFAIAVFVVACPCGIALAAPTAIFVGGGLAARYGVLAKGGGEAFEIASKIGCVVFDKTGTLTQGGEPVITDSKFFLSPAPTPNFSSLEEEEEEEEESAPSAMDTPPVMDGEDREKKKSSAAATLTTKIAASLAIPLAGPDTPTLLAALKAVEENSSHVIAKAIVAFCSAQLGGGGPSPSPTGTVDDLQELPGKGMRAVFTPSVPSFPSFEIIVGNKALMADFSAVEPAGLDATITEWTTAAKSVALVATRPVIVPATEDQQQHQQHPYIVCAALAISDPIRPEAALVIAALRRRGVAVYMLSGDNAATARAVGVRLGIAPDQVLAEVLPEQKAEQIKRLQASFPSSPPSSSTFSSPSSSRRRAIVAMVGDGVNDAPALAQADVGVAVGSGSDVAISSAGFVLVKSDLRNVVTLLELSRCVFRRIRVNFGWALVYNLVAVPVAAGAFYPLVGRDGEHIRLDPVWASLAMALSSISVVLSSLALRSRFWVVGFRPTVIPVAEEVAVEDGDDEGGVMVCSEENRDIKY